MIITKNDLMDIPYIFGFVQGFNFFDADGLGSRWEWDKQLSWPKFASMPMTCHHDTVNPSSVLWRSFKKYVQQF